jgi:hypothetical protein
MIDPESLRETSTEGLETTNLEARLLQQLAMNGMAESAPADPSAEVDMSDVQQNNDAVARALRAHPFLNANPGATTSMPATIHYDPNANFRPYGR